MNVHTPEADDYNKYLVVADPITSEASKEPAFTVEQLQQNIDNMATLAQVAKPLYVSDTTLDAVVSTYEQNKHALFLQDMASFLQTNHSFWTTMMETLLDMTALSTELTRKIQDSK